MTRSTIVWDESLSSYKILGSVSPATFRQKFKQVPDTNPPYLSSSGAVFVDILRATTTLVAVGAAGSKGIVVDKKPQDSIYSFTAPILPHESWVFGGEFNGSPITGIDGCGERVVGVIDNSPRSVRRETFESKYLRFFSTNGADAFDALTPAMFASISALSFANIAVTAADLVERNPERVWLVCGGFYGGSSVEDTVAAGFLIKRLVEIGYATEDQLDDEAQEMVVHAKYFQHGREFLEQELLTRLQQGQVFKLLDKRGHGGDVETCINGNEIPDLWDSMRQTALVCTDMDQRLLIPITRK